MAIAGKPDEVNTVLPKAQGYKVEGPGTVDFGDKNVVKTWARNILGLGVRCEGCVGRRRDFKSQISDFRLGEFLACATPRETWG